MNSYAESILASKKLKTDWKPPSAPSEFPILTAVIIDERWLLDFTKPSPSFALNDHKLSYDEGISAEIVWPFVDGYMPSSKDWSALGFKVLKPETIRPEQEPSIAIRIGGPALREMLALISRLRASFCPSNK